MQLFQDKKLEIDQVNKDKNNLITFFHRGLREALAIIALEKKERKREIIVKKIAEFKDLIFW